MQYIKFNSKGMLSFMVINAKQRKVCSIISNGRWILMLMLKECLRNPLLRDCFFILGGCQPLFCLIYIKMRRLWFGISSCHMFMPSTPLFCICHFLLRSSHHICFVGQADVFSSLVPWWFLCSGVYWAVGSGFVSVCVAFCNWAFSELRKQSFLTDWKRRLTLPCKFHQQPTKAFYWNSPLHKPPLE